LPDPIIKAAGVAIPRAQGHAMIITETNARSEKVRPILPAKYQPSPAAIAIKITAGTKYFATVSAILCIGAFPIRASSTSLIICDRTVSCPTFVALTFIRPFRFIVPPITSCPTVLSTGILSPVIADSSTEEEPSTTSPSTGILSPGLITNVSFS
jgi:hypothetical protein